MADKEFSYGFGFKDIPKLLVIILGVSIICLFFPSKKAIDHQYGIGQKWEYDNVYTESPFTAVIQIQQDSIIESTVNYQAGSLVVAKGQFITNALNQTLDQFLPTTMDNSSILSGGWIYFIGHFILTMLIIGALVLYAYKYFPQSCQSVRGVVFLIIWPVIYSIIVYFVSNSQGLNVYLIPFCITPIVVLNFYNGRLALVIHIVVILIASFLIELGYEFIFLQILAGIVTVLVMTETRFWNKFFVAILVILCTYLLAYLGLAIINSGTIIPDESQVFIWLCINALLLLLAYPFIPMLEKIFGFTSTITLAELADMNKPLLKDLSIKAPGTLQHSLQVANLSEAAAKEIGADSLLVKTAALYHDIGKTKQPEYFIENSMGSNPHEKITNFESARIIIDHVIEGEKMAKNANLPKLLIDFIATHHGTTRVEYFYRTQLKEEPGRQFDESLFRYPGPKPKTKEQTILMLADSIEAASKSLKNPTGQDIDQLIDKIIDLKLANEQLIESELSFQELEKCKTVFSSLLRSIYHIRIEYPREQTNKKNSEEE
ncbi:MAG: HD family phosphohydrolase [Saprospiraceae bacterium]